MFYLQYGGFPLEGLTNLKARSFAEQLRADGEPFEEGAYATAGYDPVRYLPSINKYIFFFNSCLFHSRECHSRGYRYKVWRLQ